MSSGRVVITGLGPVAPAGVGRRKFWDGLLSGHDCAAEVERFDTSMYKVHRACELRGWQPPELPGEAGPAARLAAAAARLALEDAGLAVPEDPAEPLARAPVILGTTGGEIPVLERLNRQRFGAAPEPVAPEAFPKYPCHTIAVRVAEHLGLTGPAMVVPTACAAGNYALALARDWIRAGRAEVVLAGGSDPLSIVSFTGFGRLFAISPDVVRPFDRNRKGILPGEGAGVLVLESLEHARRRDARIHAEILGAGLSCDAHHPTMPHPDGAGARLAMERALRDAGVAAEQVGWISAHGTGTPANDRIETRAIRAVFGNDADRIPVSSVKSMMGHTMGAASALEAIACCLVLAEGALPPTIHYEVPDPDCDLDYVPNEARAARVSVVLNNAWAFGGNNACVVLGGRP